MNIQLGQLELCQKATACTDEPHTLNGLYLHLYYESALSAPSTVNLLYLHLYSSFYLKGLYLPSLSTMNLLYLHLYSTLYSTYL